MRRLLRWAFNFVAVVSAVLFVAVCVLWVRSYYATDYVRTDGIRSDTPRVYGATNDCGQLLFWASNLRGFTWRGHSCVAPAVHVNFTPPLPGITFKSSGPGAATTWKLGIRHWLLASILLPWPLAHGIAGLRRRKQRSGLCPSCGYDLRATPDRCPECGHVPAKKGAET